MSRAAIVSVTRAEVRSSWRTLVVIGLVAGLAGTAAVGALAVARRTDTAYERLAARAKVGDVRGMSIDDPLVDEIVDLPGVADRWIGRTGVAQIGDAFNFLSITAGPSERSDMLEPILLRGRLPESTERDVIEIVIRDDFERETGLTVGTKTSAAFLTKDDYFSFDTGFEGGAPNGPRLQIEVVGVVRMPGTMDTMPPAMTSAETLRAHPSAFEPTAAWFVRLDEGRAGVDQFIAAVDDLVAATPVPPEASEFRAADADPTHQSEAGVDHTAALLGRALLVVAAAISAVGLLAVAQALARHQAARRETSATEAALGLTRRQRTIARVTAALVPAAVATALTASAALWASPIEPLGAIRNYEPHPGTTLNVGVVAAGCALVAGLVLALAAVTGTVAARRRPEQAARPSWIVTQATRLPRSVASVTGLRFALEPGRGVRAVPVRSAIVGVAVGIAGTVAGMVVVASLDRLTGSAERSGIPFDVQVSNVDDDTVDALLAHPHTDAVVTVRTAPVVLESSTISAYALEPERGELDIQLTDGRLPRTPDEVTIGLRLQDDLGVRVGDTVTAQDPEGGTHELAVVGVGVVPPFNLELLGLNALLTGEGLAATGASDTFASAAVTAKPGTDPGALADELAEHFEAGPPPLPYEVDNLRQLGRLPTVAAATVGLIALLALANAVVALVRRRRADLAMLRALGFTRAETRVAVLTMAASLALVGVTVGVPLGLAAGRWIWAVTARGAFVATDAIAPALLLAALALGAVLVGISASVAPAVRAGRITPARLLRAE